MGVFHDMAEIVNRTDEPLMVTYDGQRMYLQPNYDADGKLLAEVHNQIPRQVIPYALSQNVNMGTEDPFDPSRWQSLIGVMTSKKEREERSFKAKSWHDVKFIPRDERNLSPTRVDLATYLEDDTTVKEIKSRGRRMNVERVSTTPFELRTS